MSELAGYFKEPFHVAGVDEDLFQGNGKALSQVSFSLFWV